MADFITTTSSNSPEITDPEAVRAIIARWYVGEDLSIEVDSAGDHPTLEFWGGDWPEMARKPEGAAQDWTPAYALDWDGPEGIAGFMLEVAPYLKDRWVIQAIGRENYSFPLSARELVVAPGATEVTVHKLGSR